MQRPTLLEQDSPHSQCHTQEPNNQQPQLALHECAGSATINTAETKRKGLVEI